VKKANTRKKLTLQPRGAKNFQKNCVSGVRRRLSGRRELGVRNEHFEKGNAERLEARQGRAGKCVFVPVYMERQDASGR